MLDSGVGVITNKLYKSSLLKDSWSWARRQDERKMLNVAGTKSVRKVTETVGPSGCVTAIDEQIRRKWQSSGRELAEIARVVEADVTEMLPPPIQADSMEAAAGN